MMTQKWSKADRIGLSRYVIEEGILSQVGLSISNREGLIKTPDGRKEILREIYEALLRQELNYALEKYYPEEAIQLIRLPSEILNAPKEGTCLDLSLLFCSLCWEADLLPLLIILKGHALAAVSLWHYKREWDRFSPERNFLKKEDVISDLSELEKLREWLQQNKYLAIECTGFARANFPDLSEPEAQARNNKGYLDFDEAVKAGQQQLNSKTRSFEYAIDIAVALYYWKVNYSGSDPGRSKKFRLPAQLDDILVARPNEREKIKKELKQNNAVVVILWGFVGYGKTTLAKLICWDTSIQQYYTGGIYYLEINKALDAKQGIKILYKYLTDFDQDIEPEDLAFHWKEEPTLVVLDNIQSQEILEIFLKSRGQYCQFLITTENRDTFKNNEAYKLIEIEPLTDEELMTALKYAFRGLGKVDDREIKKLSDLLYDYPVLLQFALQEIKQYFNEDSLLTPKEIINHVIEDIKAINWSDEELFEELFDKENPIAEKIKKSFQFITEKEQEYFYRLFIFSPDLNIPFSVIEKLLNLSSLKVKRLCIKFSKLSLLKKFSIHSKFIQLDSILHKYIISNNEIKPILNKSNDQFISYYEKNYNLQSIDNLSLLSDQISEQEKRFLKKVYNHLRSRKYKNLSEQQTNQREGEN